MERVQIVYSLIASQNDLYLQEIWASVYSLRLYEPNRIVKVLCDAPTADYLRQYPDLTSLISEIIAVPVPNYFNSKERSREIKTTIRRYITGDYLFLDTDTIIAGTLSYIDSLTCDIAAVPEYHLPLAKSLFRSYAINDVDKIFGIDVSDAKRNHNSGVMFVADTHNALVFYEKWNANWRYSAFEKGNSQDQPSLIKTDKEMGYIIQELPGEYNCQLAMSVKHYHEAKIIHYLHFNLLPAPKNPFINKELYRQMKNDGGINENTANIIRNCKSALEETSAIVDGATIGFLISNPGHVFLRVFTEGGLPLSIMNKIAGLYGRWFKFIDKRKHSKQ